MPERGLNDGVVMDDFVISNIQIYALNVSSGHWTPSNSRSKLSLDGAPTVLYGHLKLWDVAAGALQQELKERDHLSYRYTCLTCSQPASKSKKRCVDSDLGLLALGASNGSVVVWDLAMKHTLQNETSHAVQALVFNPQDSLLYASSIDNYVLEWSVSSGQTERKFRVGSGGASALGVSSDIAVLAAGGSALPVGRQNEPQDRVGSVVGRHGATLRRRRRRTRGVPVPVRCDGGGSCRRTLCARDGWGSCGQEEQEEEQEGGRRGETRGGPATTPAGAMFVWLHNYEQVSDVAELALASKPLPPTLAAEQSAGVLLAEISTQED
ncbi:WD repeat-containing protein 43 [Phytophthora ramorum]|uniref:WD repeat-containing protein 43 n=1 Tax=Phytophthora ramorum TaxID=164328 RepID=UPI0030A0D86F|nr:WD repeat-containing protein 43 [Phytophthora ramorum]